MEFPAVEVNGNRRACMGRAGGRRSSVFVLAVLGQNDQTALSGQSWWAHFPLIRSYCSNPARGPLVRLSPTMIDRTIIISNWPLGLGRSIQAVQNEAYINPDISSGFSRKSLPYIHIVRESSSSRHPAQRS